MGFPILFEQIITKLACWVSPTFTYAVDELPCRQYFKQIMKFDFTFKDELIHVGFSGGADSTALLLLLIRHGVQVRAVHFEHGIRGQASIEDAVWCRKFCHNRNIEYQEISLSVPERMNSGENLEAVARRLRLEAWEEIAGNTSITVALGHHADDRVENLLIRLGRGSNVSGLSSMRETQRFGNILFFRPLLKLRRIELEDFLHGNGVSDWRCDVTNRDEVMQRNYLRNIMLPEWSVKFPPVENGLLRAAEVLEVDADYLENVAAKQFSSISAKSTVPLEFWRSLHPALRVRVLRSWIIAFSGSDFVPNRNFLERFNIELESASTENRLLEADNGCALSFDRSEVWLKKTRVEPFSSLLWHWRKCPKIAGFSIEIASAIDEHGINFDAELLPDVLKISVPKPGDTMIPFGASMPKKLKKIISDAKLSAKQKSELRVLAIPNGEIIWIPGVRRSAFAPITDKTMQIVVLKFTRA